MLRTIEIFAAFAVCYYIIKSLMSQLIEHQDNVSFLLSLSIHLHACDTIHMVLQIFNSNAS